MRLRILPVIGLLLFSFSAHTLPPSVLKSPVRQEKGISFINVAPGEFSGAEEEKSWLDQFNVKIMFRSETKVPYGGVYVRIFDEAGIQVLGRLCEKPWLLLGMPEGDYHVVAVDRHHIQRIKPFQARTKGLKTVDLKWPKTAVGY